ncbi:hypothetical protein WNY78_06185 [Psychroserpens sp. AS72]|uniref:hypothetical protein n=1 Tax=Psychroserpens sp. AS72 TaxID=3135775 RepID=UPI003177F3B1
MFIRRKTLVGRKKFDKKFIVSLKELFIEAKLKTITVKIPHNYVQKDEPNELDIDEFLNLDRNFPAIILRAINEKKNEEIKILFVNISTNSYFYDHTFPSGHSEPSEIYVSTNDPVRTWGLFEYFYNYLKKVERNNRFDAIKLIGFFLSIVMLMAEFSSLIGTKTLFLNKLFGYSIAFDLGAIALSFILIYSYYNSAKGVYIKERKGTVSYFLMRILKGEFRDNPMFNLIISVLASVIAAVIMSLLGY